MSKKLSTTIILLIFIFNNILESCKGFNEYDSTKFDYANDTLKIVSLDIPYGHYCFNGNEYGYHYELIKEFTNRYNIKHSIIYTSSIDSIYYFLENNICHLAAYNIIPPNGYYACGDTLYSEISVTTSLPSNENPAEMSDSTIYCTSEFISERIKLFSEESGLNLHVKTVNSNTEKTFELLSKKTLNYVATFNSIANMMRYEFPQTGKSFNISLPYKLSWCTKDKELADSINSWYKTLKRKRTRLMCNYSYLSTKGKKNFKYISKQDNLISNYDPLFRKYAKLINWDWKLLAALAYTESNFDPEQTSYSGAIGLMQMMPVTAKNADIPKENLFIPEENLKVCTEYISYLQKAFSDINNPEEKIKFILGAYNSGPGHIYDAMALAKKHKYDEQKWDCVIKFLLLKNTEKYYNDNVCKFGYFNGKQTKALVDKTLDTYYLYKSIFK